MPIQMSQLAGKFDNIRGELNAQGAFNYGKVPSYSTWI